jgi:transcriptional regulator with XRE-family HTH domain
MSWLINGINSILLEKRNEVKKQKRKNNMTRWNDSSYQRIREAKFENNKIVINFENGDTIELSKEGLTPFHFQEINWSELQYTPFEIIIPAKPEALEISWDKLRVITDKEFAKHLAQKSEEQSKLIGVKVRRLRDKKGISSKDLAERAGVTPQTISRIEQGRSDVSFATLRKILAAMGYSLKDLANQELELESSFQNLEGLKRRLSYAGIDSNLLINKIIPSRLIQALQGHKNDPPKLLIDEAASYVSRIYGWAVNDIWSENKLIISNKPAAMAFFKKPSNANENQIKAYSHYAYYLAKIVLKGSAQNEKKEYPESLEDFKENYFTKYSELKLETLLEFVWELGIAVLPLNDSGVFHGASWNIEGRHIIVLKQVSIFHARWIFDLLHELYHVFAHLENENTSVIEVEELTPFSNNDSIEELEANSFANHFIFGDRAIDLAEKCIEVANWKIENLKSAVVRISEEEKVGVDLLSNYLAYRLSSQGENWWGTATKLQISEPNPFGIASDFLVKKIQMQKLSPMDFNLLNTAISN